MLLTSGFASTEALTSRSERTFEDISDGDVDSLTGTSGDLCGCERCGVNEVW